MRAGRRASVSSTSANRPSASGSSGIRSASSLESLIASAERSVRVSLAPEDAAYPSL
ncbi:Uncharacterised protein [Mycobacteroides abscessus subsp. abscessus]|nr:Uncharacterised protein [Mycobacteroides abscessus subsp. abscessus]